MILTVLAWIKAKVQDVQLSHSSHMCVKPYLPTKGSEHFDLDTAGLVQINKRLTSHIANTRDCIGHLGIIPTEYK